MYTLSSTLTRRTLVALVAATAWRGAEAQDPVRLPAVVTKAAPLPPGPRTMVGVVRDTSAFTIDSVEITIPALQRRMFSNIDGAFRFADIKPGTYQVRARKIGYAPQIREIKVDTAGGTAAFELLHLARALPAMISTAAGGGLSGVVGDTAYNAVPGAYVALMGHGLGAVTDSSGRFFIPAQTGSHMVSIKRAGFADRLVSVNIPPDSGRHMTVTLEPAHPVPVREHWNVADFSARLSWRSRQTSAFYTREDMEKLNFEWVSDVVVMGVGASAAGRKTEMPSRDCSVIINGGPTTGNLATLTIDDVEAVEIYTQSQPVSGGEVKRPASRMVGKKGAASTVVGLPIGNTSRAAIENGANPSCPIVYVWTR